MTTRIDSHQHFWKYDAREYGWIDERMGVLRRDFLPADLEPPMRAAGFDACVAVQARHSLDETAWLLDLADRAPFVAGVVGWVDLCSPEARAQLQRFAKHPKLVGVRHIVQGEPDDRFMLSGLVTEADWKRWTADQLRPYLDVAFECFGPGRLMIGSDWPVCTLAGDYGRTMAVVTDYLQGRPGAEREAVLGGNAREFWNLRSRSESDA